MHLDLSRLFDLQNTLYQFSTDSSRRARPVFTRWETRSITRQLTITPETAYADAAQFADKELIHISSSTRFFRIALEVELATPPRRFIASVSAASSRDWLMRLVSNDERDFDRSHATWTNSLHHTCTRREKSLHSRRIRKGNSWTSAVQVGTVVRLSSRTSWIQWNRVNAQ